MKKPVEISLVIPVYGVDQYIAEFASSVLSQNYPYVQFVFVNDGTKDNSIKVLKNLIEEKFQSLKEKILIVDKENGGLSDARNAGMEVAALPDDPKCVEKMLTEKLGYTKFKYTKDERCTLNEFAIAHPFGTYICKMRRHIVAVVDGFYYDSWDSGNKKVTEYYEK
mgnify:CR=1 FL=1